MCGGGVCGCVSIGGQSFNIFLSKGRMTSKDSDVKSDGVDGEWTEHFSNTRGHLFFYNKKLDVKQWETPKRMVKR